MILKQESIENEFERLTSFNPQNLEGESVVVWV